MDNKKENPKTIKRLSRYRLAIKKLRELGYNRITSTILGDKVGVTAAQIRKDFSKFEITGKRKGGYVVEDLLVKLEKILGKDRVHKLVLAGVGNLGRALIDYNGFYREGIEIIAGFDIDFSKLKKMKIPVYPVDKMSDYIKSHRVQIGIIAVPEIAAQQVCNTMVSAGIRGILNFAPVRLITDESVVIQYVNIQNKLENIFYFVENN
jgi:redox-sensing transcriptional repressor